MYFYLGAVVLIVVGALLMKKTSPFSRVGGRAYERKRKRKVLGVLLLVVAALALGAGAIVQLLQSHPQLSPN
jgi:uncharacterized membrane protein